MTFEADVTSEARWALSLFRRSVIKQQKHRALTALLPPLDGCRCLDIGGDNGVMSYLLRLEGGEWSSADLHEVSVSAIRRLVGGDVRRMDDGPAPFETDEFDMIAVVDFLEHVKGDRAVAAELARILRPGGCLIVNVPHLKPRSIINRLRHLVGLTDEQHGHVRPGYDLDSLQDVLGPAFRTETVVCYSKAFSELLDTLLNAGILCLRRLGRGGGESAGGRKGTVVTAQDWSKQRTEVAMLSVLYPFMFLFSKLDVLLPFQRGYKLLIRTIRTDM